MRDLVLSRFARLIAVLLALAGVLAAPAFAVSLGPAAAPPCHGVLDATSPDPHAGHGGTTQPDSDALRAHRCCVVACLLGAPPPASPGLAMLRPAADWDALAGPLRLGREPVPADPPPRTLS